MKKIIIIIFTFFCSSFFLNATNQTCGSITGIVTDKSTQNPLPGTTIIIEGLKKGDITDSEGKYEIKDLPIGSYNVKISRMGYETIVKNRVIVKAGKPTYLDVSLSIKPTELTSITVIPTYFPEVNDAIVSSKNMDYEELITQPGSTMDVQRSIQALPSVVSGADQNNEIIVRGGNYGENLFMMDNIEVPNPNHFGWQGTGGGPISMINIDFVKEIDFMAGAFPAKYGFKASSAMDIKMREGAMDGLHSKLDLGMAGYGGSIEGPIGKKGNYLFSAHNSFLSLISTSFGLTVVPEYWDTQGKITYEITPKQKISFIGVYGKDKIYFDKENIEEGMDYTVDYRSKQHIIGINYKILFDKGYSLLTYGNTSNYWNSSGADTADLSKEIFHNKSTESENTYKFDMVYLPQKNIEISLGTYFKDLEYNYDMHFGADSVFLYQAPDYDTIIDTLYILPEFYFKKNENGNKYGGYLQYQQRIGKFTFHLGGRYDYFTYNKKGTFSPRCGLIYNLKETTALKLAYGRHYQNPEWYQLTFAPENKELKPKYTDQVVFGLDHLFKEDIKGTIEIYYKKYNDGLIEKSYTTPNPYDMDYRYYVNKLKGYSKGIEFFLQKKVKENLWGTLSYSYSISKMKDPRYPDKEFNWDFDYRHVFTSIVGYRKEFRGVEWYENMKNMWWYKGFSWLPFLPGDQTEVSFKWRYLGGRPYTPKTWHPEWQRWTLDEVQDINAERMKNYSRLDLRIDRRWYFGKWNLLTYFDIQNLLNTKNIWGYEYIDGKNHKKETIYQFGFMPVGGVVIEF